MYRAVIEGWSLAADEALSALGSSDRPKDVVCVGGGSASALWLQVKASIAVASVTKPFGATAHFKIGVYGTNQRVQ